MNKIQQDVEQYIRHLQSILDKRKDEIKFVLWVVNFHTEQAKQAFEQQKEYVYQYNVDLMKGAKDILKQLHKEQATETRMLKFFENARSFAIALETCK
jgi:hypothetical protein